MDKITLKNIITIFLKSNPIQTQLKLTALLPTLQRLCTYPYGATNE